MKIHSYVFYLVCTASLGSEAVKAPPLAICCRTGRGAILGAIKTWQVLHATIKGNCPFGLAESPGLET